MAVLRASPLLLATPQKVSRGGAGGSHSCRWLLFPPLTRELRAERRAGSSLLLVMGGALLDPFQGDGDLQQTLIMCKYLPQLLEITTMDPPDDIKAIVGCDGDIKF